MRKFILLIQIAHITLSGCQGEIEKKSNSEADAYIYSTSSVPLQKNDSSIQKFNKSEDPFTDKDFDEFVSRLDTVMLNGQVYYFAEYDLFLTFKDVLRYYYIERRIENKDIPKLTILREKGEDIKQNDPMNISFAISKQSFKNNAEYLEIQKLIQKAALDWENTCAVKFEYKNELDADIKPYQTPRGLTFIVQKLEQEKSWYAKAPFPNHEKRDQQLIISNRFFNSDFTKDGMLRHELGHILGFLHEHLRKEADKSCPPGIFRRARYVTEYDKKSVMHTFCKIGSGTLDMQISLLDSLGSQCIYPSKNTDTGYCHIREF